MNTFDVALRTGTLPENPVELAKMVYFGESALAFLRANLAKANELEIPEEQRKTMLAEGQKIGIALLDAESKIGELSKTIPNESNTGIIHNPDGSIKTRQAAIQKHENNWN